MGDRSDGTPLVVVCGLPGVGKSTVSRAIADRLDAAVLRTDVVRKELFEEPAYTAEETAAVYDELLSRARKRLNAGPVVLDGTFKRRDRRVDARDLAASTGASFRLVRVDCDEAVVEERIAEREGVSDADLDVHRRFRDRFDPVEMDHLVVDNSGTEAATRQRIEEAF